MKSNNKTLMFQISTSLSKVEAIQFAETLDKSDKYYLVLVHENPKARHLAKRERFVIVRHPHKNETVPDGWVMVTGKNQLISIN